MLSCKKKAWNWLTWASLGKTQKKPKQTNPDLDSLGPKSAKALNNSLAQRTWQYKVNLLDQNGKTKRSKGRPWASEITMK